MAEMTAEYMRARWAGIRAIPLPVLPETVDPVAEAIIAAQNTLDPVNLGRNYSEAVVLYAAHLAELGKPGRAGGQQHARAGLVEIDFGNRLAETAYGKLYANLIKHRPELRISTVI